MAYGEGGLSASDIALIQDRNCSNNGYGFGEGNGWWIVLFLLVLLGGWGRGFGNGYGYGGFGGSTGGVADNYVLTSDFAQVDRKLDTISNGICDSTFALNNTMTNGFANVQNTLCQGFAGINTAITTNGYETRLGVQSLAAQLANCCCDLGKQISDCCCQTNANIKDVSYNIAMGNNAIQQTLCNNTRDIIDNQNANYRALHDEIVANRIEDKNAQIAAQQNEINALRLAASQEKQNAYITANQTAQTAELIRRLGADCPTPAYIVPNPNCCYNYQVTGCGYGNGCNSCC